jgi:hypothetical protein
MTVMLVTLFEVLLGTVGFGLVVLGVYGIVRGKYDTQTSGKGAGLEISIPLSGLVLALGLGSLGLTVYLAANEIAKTSTAAAPGVSSPSISPAPAVARSPNSTRPRSSAGAPSVVIAIPRTGTLVSDSKGFATSGTFSSLGEYTLWIFDYDGGTNYTIDEAANVYVSSRKWSAFDGPGLGSGPFPFPLTMAVVAADSSCNARLNQLSDAAQYNILSLPSGCEVVAETTVNVSKP